MLRSKAGIIDRRQQFEEVEREPLNSLPALGYEARQQSVVTAREERPRLPSGRQALLQRALSLYRQEGKAALQLIVGGSLAALRVHLHCIRGICAGYQYTTLTEHLASSHRYQSEWSEAWFMEQGEKISPEVAAYISKVIEHKQPSGASLQVLLRHLKPGRAKAARSA